MIRAAGILFLTPDNRALFLKRGPGSDHPLEWAFPGGQLEDGETPLEAAIREVREETGLVIEASEVHPWTHSINKGSLGDAGAKSVEVAEGAPADAPPLTAIEPGAVTNVLPSEDVDYTTFIAKLAAEVAPTLNDEHTGWAWADIAAPPEPLHPGCRIAINRLGWNELDIARAIAAGELTSPQEYENLSLFAMRVTGTGRAFRIARNEHVWRDPSLYLTEEFCARCAGLPVILEHPEKPSLDTKEYLTRVIGALMFAYIQGEEVWAIARINDKDAAHLMRDKILSTSPAVVFRGADVNTRLQLENGTFFLIEGEPSLLDHLAICSEGVWDKGAGPQGIIVHDSTGETALGEKTETAEDKARKDAEEMADRQRRDSAIMDALKDMASKMDSVATRMDALEGARRDGVKDGVKKDASTTEAKEVAADRGRARKDGESDEAYNARCDAEEEAERKDRARKDAEEKARDDAEEKARKDAERMRMDSVVARIADVERALPRQRAADEAAELLATQARYDAAFHVLGDSAPRFLDGEDVATYRRRLLAKLKPHSATWKGVNIHGIADAAALGQIESQVIQDAVTAGKSGAAIPAGQIRGIESNQGGHTIIEYVGTTADTWMGDFGGRTKHAVTGFRQRG